MAISYSPKVGELLECNYGDFLYEDDGTINRKNYNGRIPPEMVKNRLVVVLNGKISGGSTIIVPISSTQDLGKIAQGLHIPIPQEHIQVTNFYDQRDRWAKADLVQQVSKERLFKVKDANGVHITQYLPRDLMENIQKAVVTAISAKSLLK
ncbi:MAG: type II toxin-antitoxin system PemK/MazF family toxin [Aeromonas sp.]